MVDKGLLSYGEKELFPLHKVADAGESAIIINRVGSILEAVFGSIVSYEEEKNRNSSLTERVKQQMQNIFSLSGASKVSLFQNPT